MARDDLVWNNFLASRRIVATCAGEGSKEDGTTPPAIDTPYGTEAATK